MSTKVGSLSAISGALVGAGLMYVLDPDRGDLRRARLRRQLARAGRKATAIATRANRILHDPARLFS